MITFIAYWLREQQRNAAKAEADWRKLQCPGKPGEKCPKCGLNDPSQGCKK